MSCHIIDSNCSFVEHKSFCELLRLRESGDASHYWVVGIFGGQSTGKSTLMNGIFGTTFETMNDDGARTQTTRGIWLAQAQQCATLFAMDVEGTDGQEQFDNQTFERRTSLFALAMCDVFMINMWTAEVGRFNAANLSLLRTIFEMRLELFPRGSVKTKLLFVLRDHVSGTLEKHADVVRTSLMKVWENVYKGKQESEHNLNLEDVFSLNFYSLPHYHLQREDFNEKIAHLRDMLTPGLDQSLLSGCAGAKEDVPLMGLHTYMNSVWATVCDNKDLDIPTQKELLAKHRCLEISKRLTNEAKGLTDVWHEKICEKKTLVPGLGDAVTKLAFESENKLREEAKLYSDRTVNESGVSLREAILKLCEDILQAQVDLVLCNQQETLIHQVHSLLEASLMKGGGPTKTWPMIRRGLVKVQENVDLVLHERIAEGILDDRTHSIAQTRLKECVDESILQRLKTISQDVHKHMHSVFEYSLHHHADGSNRFFHSANVLSVTANRSQEIGFDYLDSVCANRLHCPEQDEQVRIVKNGPTVGFLHPLTRSVEVVLDAAACQKAYDLYLQQVDFTVQLLQKSIEMGSNRIPWYFWLALIYFARNDFWFVLENPLILLGILALVYCFFLGHIKDIFVSFVAEPPIWFHYIEFFLEKYMPNLSQWIRDKRAAIVRKVGGD